MNRKRLRSAFLKAGQQLLDANQRLKQAQADAKLADRTRYLIAGLRAADSPPGLGNSTAQTWLLVWNYRTAPAKLAEKVPGEPLADCPADNSGCAACCPGTPKGRSSPPKERRSHIVEVQALIVPEIIRPKDRHQPLRQNADGSTTWSSQPFPRERLVEEVIQRYAEGRVAAGELAHAQTVPCRHCGQPALLVLEHTRDFDSEVNNLRISELCLACPAAHDRAFGRPVHARKSHPAFPYREKEE